MSVAANSSSEIYPTLAASLQTHQLLHVSLTLVAPHCISSSLFCAAAEAILTKTCSRGQWPVHILSTKISLPLPMPTFSPGSALGSSQCGQSRQCPERGYLLLGKYFFSERVLAILVYLGFLHTFI